MLSDLDTARRQLFARDGKSPQFDLIAKSVATCCGCGRKTESLARRLGVRRTTCNLVRLR
jgi:hypothetical protein